MKFKHFAYNKIYFSMIYLMENFIKTFSNQLLIHQKALTKTIFKVKIRIKINLNYYKLLLKLINSI